MSLYLGSTKVSPTVEKEYVGIPLEISAQGVLQKPTNFTWTFPSGATQVGDYGLYYAFYNCTGLTSVDLSSVEGIFRYGGFFMAFSHCTGLTNVDFSNLTSINANVALCNAFQFCTNLTSITFPKLASINRYADATAFGGTFGYCTKLQSVSFPALTSTSFGSNVGIGEFSNMLISVTGCTVHFPSNLQSVIGSWTTVTDGFGGTNTTVLFDLPATE